MRSPSNTSFRSPLLSSLPGMGLTAKLLAALLLAALLPLAAAAFLGERASGDQMRRRTESAVAGLSEHLARELGLTVSGQVKLLAAFAGSGEAASALGRGIPGGYGAASREQDPGLLARELERFQRTAPWHLSLVAATGQGAVVAATGPAYRDQRDQPEGRRRRVDDEAWWQAAWNHGAGATYVGGPRQEPGSGLAVLDLAVAVPGPDGAPVGVLESTLDARSLRDLVSSSSFQRTGRMAVHDLQGKAIFAADPLALARPLPAVLQPAAGLPAVSGARAGTSPEGVDSLFGFARIAGAEIDPAVRRLGWTTVAAIDAAEALAPAATASRIAAVAAFLGAALAMLLAYLISQGLLRQIGEIGRLASQVGRGNFADRARVLRRDELGRATAGLNSMLEKLGGLLHTEQERDRIQASIVKLLEEVSGVAQGDLTVEAEVSGEITGAIADAFNYMVAELRGIIRRVQTATLEVTSSAKELEADARRVAETSEAQATQLAQTSAAVDTMARSIVEVAESARVADGVAHTALERARSGAEAVRQTVAGMGRIRGNVQETARRIKRLGESSKEIGEIVKLIGDIADRTSILALNAAIQAASAGEAGRGFAVVAEEVQRLAERSTEATRQIGALVTAIQSETLETVVSMEESTRGVVAGSEVADQAGQALAEINSVAERIAEIVQSITAAAQRQAHSSVEISTAMDNIAGVTAATASSTRQSAIAVSRMAELADTLRTSVSAFQLPEAASRKPPSEASPAYQPRPHEASLETGLLGGRSSRVAAAR